jgi:tRNA (guanine37-N1)-methyltransferase
MRFDIVTIFPEFFTGPLDYGVVRRAREAGLIETEIHDLRDFTHDRHKTVDDRPFGGGEGMVLKAGPIFEAVESLLGARDSGLTSAAVPKGTAIVLLSAAGRLFRQETAQQLAELERLVLLCGRYEGVDERVAEHLATHEISVGDFVLSGGELPAAMVAEAVVRLIPGALGNQDSTINESFRPVAGFKNPTPNSQIGLPQPASAWSTKLLRPAARYSVLDYPHYTRPASFRGWSVPQALLSGNHEEIRRWRYQQAIEKTIRNRPDLLARRPVPTEDGSAESPDRPADA